MNIQTEVTQRKADGAWIARAALPFGFTSESFATESEARAALPRIAADFAAIFSRED